MAKSQLGRTLVIANPAARSGGGTRGAELARRFLASHASVTDGFDVRLTDGPGDGTNLARAAEGFRTVVALGGDGIIHEVVNGLMGIGGPRRPRLAVVPMGSGNDFARTLHAAANAPEASLAELLQGTGRTVELGLVNGTYFVETLSWGLDAAIALDTTARRAGSTRQRGSGLFLSSGYRIMATSRKRWPYRATFDDADEVRGVDIVFAVQNGPTYGGGFRVCPEAVPTDGALDACYSVGTPSAPRMLTLFSEARFGMHTRSTALRLRKFGHLAIDFDEEPPCQVDGEVLVGTHYDVRVVPHALEVIVPRSCPW